MAIQGLITPVIHHDVPMLSSEVEQAGTIHGDTAAFVVVLVGLVVALIAAF